MLKWPGDDFSSKQDLEIRGKIEKRISEKRLGKIVQSGTGMGWMDIIVDVKDKDSAQSEIEGIIRYPAYRRNREFSKLLNSA